MRAPSFTGALLGAAALVILIAAHPAFAVSLNPRGIGQVLIYPYYTVNKSQDTLVSVVNASAVGKAVQVRVLEGYNGRDVLDFVLFLSAHDVWTASISQAADGGGAQMTTSDASCTFPAFPAAAGTPFHTSGYDGSGSLPADSGPHDITRTREGSIEFLVGGDIVPGSPTDVATTHVQNGSPNQGAPPGCASLSSTGFFGDIAAPTDGIFGSGSIVNVGNGTFFAYNADALQGFTDVPLFSSASTSGPSLEDANSTESPDQGAVAYMSDGQGRPLALDYVFGIDAVSAVFMADAIYNEYLTAASLGANTDWVVTFPTKRFYVDPAYTAAVLKPFTALFLEGRSDVAVAGTVYDREEGAVPLGEPCVFCPPVLPTPPMLSYEVNVIGFQTPVTPTSATGVFGSTLTTLFIPPLGDDGQATLDLTAGGLSPGLPGGLDAQGAGVTLLGLPATGFMAYNVINANAQPGSLANYSGAFRHRSTISCQGTGAGCISIITGADAAH